MDFFVLGLKDVKIISYEQNYGRLEIVLEKTTSCETCPSCQARSKSVKNYREHRIILNPIESIQVQAFIRKRCFRCLNPSCQTKYFTEQIPGLEKNISTLNNLNPFSLISTRTWISQLSKDDYQKNIY